MTGLPSLSDGRAGLTLRRQMHSQGRGSGWMIPKVLPSVSLA